jgi:hypothetical protein
MRDDLKSAVLQRGWAMRPPGFIGFDLAAASTEFDDGYAKWVNSSGYENVVSLGPNEIRTLPSMEAMLAEVSRHMHAISPALRFEKLWLVLSKKENIQPDVVPFIPHIDKRRYLKAMIYLDEVTVGDGPFTVATSPPAQYDPLRKTFSEDYKERGMNVIRTLPPTAFVSCTGPAGSVIFFDTNCPHFAGHVQDSGRRRVFRFDFTKTAWNATPFHLRVSRAIRRCVAGVQP